MKKKLGADGAYLYLTDKIASHKVGEEFTEEILLNCAGSQINTVQAVINYNSLDFEVISDPTNSSFPMGMFNTIENGRIYIVRGIPNVSVTGIVNVSTLRIKALKSVVSATDNFIFDFMPDDPTKSCATLNDGLGTLCLTGVINSKFESKKKADINADGVVDGADLSMLLSFWQKSSVTADLNGDGIIDIKDASIMFGEWN